MNIPIDLHVAAQIINSHIPDLHIEETRFLGEGDLRIAYAVNEDWVFCFAKSMDAELAFEREAAILPELATMVRLAIPDIECFVHQPEVTFIGYRMVHGIELTSERYTGLDDGERKRCADDLAEFIAELHSFPVESAEQAGIAVLDYDARLGHDLHRAELFAYPLLNQGMRKYCERLVQRLLSSIRPPEEYVLIHDDLSQWHVLLDAETCKISGIIDFSDMVVADPAQDFMYLYDDFGPQFVRVILERLGVEDLDAYLARVHLFHEWHTLARLLWAIENRYEPGVGRRMGELAELADRSA